MSRETFCFIEPNLTDLERVERLLCVAQNNGYLMTQSHENELIDSDANEMEALLYSATIILQKVIAAFQAVEVDT